MTLYLHTTSRDNSFIAEAIYIDGRVTVKKGSKIKLNYSAPFKSTGVVLKTINNPTIVNEKGILLQDVTFNSVSTAANFVTGRISNGMIAWKTPDGRYVRETLKMKE